MEKACDLVHITLNKNAVVGDVSALAPGGVRIGAPAMTSRGLQENHFEEIADMLHEANFLKALYRRSVGPHTMCIEGLNHHAMRGERLCIVLQWDLLSEAGWI